MGVYLLPLFLMICYQLISPVRTLLIITMFITMSCPHNDHNANVLNLARLPGASRITPALPTKELTQNDPLLSGEGDEVPADIVQLDMQRSHLIG